MKLFRSTLTLMLPLILSLFIMGCSGSDNYPLSADAELSKSGDFTKTFGMPGFGRMGRHLNIMSDILELSDEQKEQIKAAFKDLKGQRHGLKREKGEPKSREEKMAMRQQNHEEIHAKIMEILTPEQRTKAESFKSQFESGQIPQEIIEYHIAHLTELLELTEEQQTALRNSDIAEKMMAGHHGKGKGKSRHGGGKKEIAKQLKEIFTQEQLAKLKAVRAEHRNERREKMKESRERRHEKMVKRLVRKLSLTEEQQEQLADFFAANRPESGREKHDARHEAMQAHRDKINAEIKTILTEEQLKIFEELLAKKKGCPQCPGGHGRG